MNVQNIKYLLQKHFIENGKKELSAFAILFVVSFCVPESSLILVFIPLYLIFYSVGSFRVFSDSNKGMNYLMIPASTKDKLIAAGILNHLYISLAVTIVYIVSILARQLFNILVLSQTAMDYSFLYPLNFDFYLTIIAFQTMGMFGAIYFKKNALLKIAGSFIVVTMIFAIIDLILFFILVRTNTDVYTNLFAYNLMGNVTELTTSIVFKWFDTILTLIFIPLFWVLSYFRLRETEV
ncbi:MAG: hypothetical protein RR356_03460 [Bacteroidales bacterium]